MHNACISLDRKVTAPEGFSLVELVTVLLLITLILGMSLSAADTQLRMANHNATLRDADASHKALALYHDKQQRYPCPADPAFVQGDPNYGVEGICCTGNMTCPGGSNAVIGMIPFVTLGLSEDYAIDSWDNKVTYIVDRLHTDANNPAIYGTLPVSDRNGNEITRSASGGDAIYMLLSHGSNGAGAWGQFSTTAPTTCNTGLLEDENCDNDAVFIDTRINESTIPANFSDDIISWKPRTKIGHITPERPLMLNNANRKAPFGKVFNGVENTCFISTARDLWCWGSDDDEQLGNSGGGAENTPVRISVTGTVTMGKLTGFSMSEYDDGGLHSCAVDSFDQLWCWGARADGRIGDGGASAGTQSSPAQVVLNDPVKVVASGASTYAVTKDNRLFVWGDAAGSNVPVEQVILPAIAPTTNTNVVADIAVSDDGLCFIRTDATVWCMGALYPGADGNAATIDPVNGLVNIIKLDAGLRHMCALTSETTNNVVCWGENNDGQISPTAPATVPITAPHVVTVGIMRDLAVGNRHSCALDASGSPWCWGANDERQSGDAPSATVGFTNIASIVDAISIAAGMNHSCVSLVDETVWCWGDNGSSQFGEASGPPQAHVPRQAVAAW